MKNSLSLYLHIPFCLKKCAYCDFYSLPRPDRRQAYTRALLRQIEEYGKKCRDYRLETVYFGGGTPSYLGGPALRRLMDGVKESFSLAPAAEITVEANPESATAEFLEESLAAGVNRLSLGVQALEDPVLSALGRPHTARQAKDAFSRARRAGFRNLSADLMYGLPGQSREAFLAGLAELLTWEPEHISCYGLTLEPGTPLFRRHPILPDGDEQAETYLAACRLLREAGYRHYEISNFARPGFLSRHNSRYWDLSPYLGLGPGAHSFWEGRRFAFDRDLDGFLAGTLFPRPEEEVPGFGRREEYLMLALRTDTGLSRQVFREKFGQELRPYEQVLKQYQHTGLTEQSEGRWRLTETGFLVSNSLIRAVLQAKTQEEKR